MRRRSGTRWLGGAALAAVVLLGACAQKGTPASRGGGSSNDANAVVLGTRSISGVGTVLDDSKGLTLYHLKTETNGSIQCTGGCASTWLPVVASSGTPAAPSGVSGTFGTIKRPDGTLQVTFDGMPLYTYTGDSGPGQANGQGVGGVWFAVTTAAAKSGGSSGKGGGYGGYGG